MYAIRSYYDGDRVVLVDETGRLVDGDQILYVLATAWQEEGRLHGSYNFV